VEDLKVCSKCGIKKTLENFGKSSGANYYRNECKDCNKELGKVRSYLKSITPPPAADYICPICNKDADQVKGAGGQKSGHWCLDHDHKTKQFRGWLCHTCNRAIGQLQDDVENLKRAIEYLEKTIVLEEDELKKTAR
jgi:hypothetical protein